MTFNAAEVQKLPEGNGADVASWAIAVLTTGGYSICGDIGARVQMGEKKYGTRLKTNNGRDALLDCYQEALDGINYAAQLILEGKVLKSDDLFWRFARLAEDIKELLAPPPATGTLEEANAMDGARKS